MAGPSAVDVVTVLFSAAGLTVPEDELDQFARQYPGLRRQADGLYRPELRTEEPCLRFSAAEFWPSAPERPVGLGGETGGGYA